MSKKSHHISELQQYEHKMEEQVQKIIEYTKAAIEEKRKIEG